MYILKNSIPKLYWDVIDHKMNDYNLPKSTLIEELK